MSSKSALLQQLVQINRFFHRYGVVNAVQLAKDEQRVLVDLISSMIALRVLKGVREENLAQFAVCLLDVRPCFRVQVICE